MVRPQVYRQKKYEAKVSGDVVKARFDALKEVMVEQTAERFADLVAFEEGVKKNILEPRGIPNIMIPFYLNVARELYKLSRKFTGATLGKEALLVKQKWTARGLSAEVIDEIIDYFGITLPSS